MADYFGPDVDEAIRRFLSSTEQVERNEIFTNEIRPAFELLIHNIIFVYKFQGVDDVDTMKAECLTHLYEMLPKFDPNRGTKGFSYFNVVTRNWFTNRSKEASRRRERYESDMPAGMDTERHRNSSSEKSSDVPFEEAVVAKEFWVSFYQEMQGWRDVPMRPQEREVLDKVIFLFQNSELISVYNPKAINIYLRELTNMSPKQIAGSLKRLREMYLAFKRRYDAGEDGGAGEDAG